MKKPLHIQGGKKQLILTLGTLFPFQQERNQSLVNGFTRLSTGQMDR